jgi:penicillin-binding protein 1C
MAPSGGLSRRQLWRGFALAGALLCAAILAGLAAFVGRMPPLDLSRSAERSVMVLDRNGQLLRPFVMADGRWRMPITIEEVDPRYLEMLIAYEDQRFWSHRGVDLLALARAAAQTARHGRIVSGGSTLTMQVARLIEPREERSITAKLRQAWRALELERRFTKREILALYLQLAPFGGNLEGVRAASLAYFGREPRRLSVAESALLVALPQSPETRRPDRNPREARAARERVLARFAVAALMPEADIARARDESIPEARRDFPRFAAHRAEALVLAHPDARLHRTDFDRGLQSSLEALARERVEPFGPDASVAMIVIELETGEIRAAIGGPSYLDPRRAGAMDLTRAIRSPGSALKPFIYALAFDEGLAHPATMLQDRPLRFGGYAPENFDPGFQGPVTAREALQQSLNLPAVDLLQAVGPQRFLSRLRQAGADIRLPDDSAPGLAIALGGLGLTLEDLTRLFAQLARVAPSDTKGAWLSPVAAWYTAEILTGAPPPDNSPMGRIAFKTGTSFGHRDAVAIGFDRRHAIGVWLGRADHAPIPGLTGRKSAAPILFEAFNRIGLTPGLPPRPRDAIVARNHELPPPLRQLGRDGLLPLAARSEAGLQIAFPPDGAMLDGSTLPHDGTGRQLTIKLTGGAPPFALMVNGLPVMPAQNRRTLALPAPGPGFSEITVMDRLGDVQRVTIRLEP